MLCMSDSINDIMQKLETYGLNSIEIKEFVENILAINDKFKQIEKESSSI